MSIVQNPGKGAVPRAASVVARLQTPDRSDSVPDAADSEAARTPIRTAVIYGLGTILLLLNAYFGTYAYVVVQALLWTQTSLQRGPVVMLFALVLLNLFVARFARRFALTRQELLILYAMLCVGTCAAGYGFVQILINQIPAPFYEGYATGGSKFKETIWPYVPAWLAPRDPEVLDPFFRGNSTLWNPVHLRGWAVPVTMWTLFIFAIFWTLMCMMTLVRRQWVEEERLTFPLVLLPLEMAGANSGGSEGQSVPFWKNRWMWIGFAIAGILESVNFLNFLLPSVPSLSIKPGMGPNEIGALFTSRPMNAMGRLTMSFYPFAIGIAYLLSLEVSFSCWFFYLFNKLLLVACSALGLSEGGSGSMANRMPYLREQSVGAFIGIAVFSAWMARKAIAEAWREVSKPTGRDRDELMSFRLAIFGGIIGALFLVGFLTAAGFSPVMSLIFVFIYLCFSLTLARIVSEAGAGWAWAPSWSPSQFTADAVGINHLTAKQTVMSLGYTNWMSDMRDNPMPQYAQATKMSQGVDISARVYLKPLVFAAIIGIIAAFWAHLDAYYMHGAATAKVRPALASGATGPARAATTLLITPTLQDIPGMMGAGVGFLVAIAFSLCRQVFPWWPLHPLGYALGLTNSMEYMWCPFFLAWLAKLITLRYGGIRAYRAALPFFLGLILGDYVVPTLWGIFGMMTGYQQYMVFPH